MPRDHARLKVSIWSDEHFRSLPVEAQHMYLTSLSQPRLSYCGVLDYLPGRIANLAADSSEYSVEQATKLLETERFVVVDRTTQELLVRTFVRHDDLLKSPNMIKAMAKDYRHVLSIALREVIESEVAKASGWISATGWAALRDADQDLHDRIRVKGSRKGSRKG